MSDKIDRRSFIRKSAAIGTVGITGLLGTTGNAAAVTTGGVTVESDQGSWEYQIFTGDMYGTKPPVEKGEFADSGDTVGNTQASGNIYEGYLDNYFFPDELKTIAVTPDGWDSVLKIESGSDKWGVHLVVECENNSNHGFNYRVSANESLNGEFGMEDADNRVDHNTWKGSVYPGGTDIYDQGGYLSYVYAREPNSAQGLGISFVDDPYA